jgi:hypothetical protein
MKKIIIPVCLLTLCCSTASFSFAQSVEEEGIESATTLSMSSNPDYTTRQELAKLSQSGMKRFEGADSPSTARTSRQDEDDVEKIIIKPTYTSIEQGVWESFVYPESRFAR